jgi:hypothetical protein
VTTLIEIASNASFVFDKTWYARKVKATNEGALLHHSLVGSKQRPPMKKEATLKCMRLKTNTSNEKRGNSKTQGTQNKDL